MMTDSYGFENFVVRFPISCEQNEKLRQELDFAITFPAAGRKIVADYFLLMADQSIATESTVQLYALFMKKLEDSYVRIEEIPPEYLVLLQSSNLVLLTVNIIFMMTSYSKKHSEHGCFLIDTLFSFLQSSTDNMPSLLSTLCHINVALETSSPAVFTHTEDQLSSSFQSHDKSEILNLLIDIYSKYPKQSSAYLKSVYLFYLDMEYRAESRGSFVLPSVLRLALETTTTTNNNSRNIFSAAMHAICVEAVAELALLLSTPLPSTSSPWDVSRLLSAISSTFGAQRLSILTIISESLIFSKLLSAKDRIIVTKYITRYLTTPTLSSAFEQMISPAAREANRKLDYESITLQSKTVMTLLDVSMLDTASSLRSEALKVLLTSLFAHDQRQDEHAGQQTARQVGQTLAAAPLVLQLGGKDLLRVAVFKCRDKALEVRHLAFQLLEQAMAFALLPETQQQTENQKTQQLSHLELIAVTKHLLQV